MAALCRLAIRTRPSRSILPWRMIQASWFQRMRLDLCCVMFSMCLIWPQPMIILSTERMLCSRMARNPWPYLMRSGWIIPWPVCAITPPQIRNFSRTMYCLPTTNSMWRNLRPSPVSKWKIQTVAIWPLLDRTIIASQPRMPLCKRRKKCRRCRPIT